MFNGTPTQKFLVKTVPSKNNNLNIGHKITTSLKTIIIYTQSWNVSIPRKEEGKILEHDTVLDMLNINTMLLIIKPNT